MMLNDKNNFEEINIPLDNEIDLKELDSSPKRHNIEAFLASSP